MQILIQFLQIQLADVPAMGSEWNLLRIIITYWVILFIHVPNGESVYYRPPTQISYVIIIFIRQRVMEFIWIVRPQI